MEGEEEGGREEVGKGVGEEELQEEETQKLKLDRATNQLRQTRKKRL